MPHHRCPSRHYLPVDHLRKAAEIVIDVLSLVRDRQRGHQHTEHQHTGHNRQHS